MNEIRTYNEKMVSPFEPNKEDLLIDDIAHSLSYLCRANGHFGQFYSVAQHSINCAIEAQKRGFSEKVQLGCLLHDGAEAYMSDIPKPLKELLPIFCSIEDQLQKHIFDKFIGVELTSEEFSQIDKIDRVLLNAEFVKFTGVNLDNSVDAPVSDLDFSEKMFTYFKYKFLSFYHLLSPSNLEGQPRNYISFDENNNRSYIGIDGCGGNGGMWLIVALSKDGFNVQRMGSIDQIYDTYNTDDKVLIDVPIGLVSNSDESLNRPDAELRKSLGKKGSSVFNAPFRPVLYEPDRKKAQSISKELGKGISSQSLGIGKYIRDVDMFLRNNDKYKNMLMESHPEYCFMILNKGIPVSSKKSEEEGKNDRIAILSKYYPEIYSLLDYCMDSFKNYNKISDDILDALCLAISAKLCDENGSATIPANPIKDEYGLNMQIVYPQMPGD